MNSNKPIILSEGGREGGWGRKEQGRMKAAERLLLIFTAHFLIKNSRHCEDLFKAVYVLPLASNSTKTK